MGSWRAEAEVPESVAGQLRPRSELPQLPPELSCLLTWKFSRVGSSGHWAFDARDAGGEMANTLIRSGLGGCSPKPNSNVYAVGGSFEA